MEKALISRCLLGEKCRWDGKTLQYDIGNMMQDYDFVAICPEMDGNLSCPRPKAEISNGNGFNVLDWKSVVLNIDGRNITDNYLKGAQKALNLALTMNIKKAILKDKSPSCGVKYIYNDGKLVEGMGVTAGLLKRHKLELISIE
jgi:uncharacterized protein YbbK (DUF523 family)